MGNPTKLRVARESSRSKLEQYAESARLEVSSLRRACRLSQIECAIRAGVGESTVKRYETGETRVAADYLLWLREYSEARGVQRIQLLRVAA
jgi:DNA-binding transcriptional regulator YiaG